MQTRFTPDQLADPDTAVSEKMIRKCVHCGFCTATCPTYVLLGDELDSPRGRIYLIKEMLEADADPTPEVVKHIDRCLSCLACTTTCPSGVDYAKLIDHARDYVEQRYQRPFADRAWRALLAWLLPSRGRFAVALSLAPLAKPFAPLMARIPALKPAAAMLALAPRRSRGTLFKTLETASPIGRVILLQGCAEPVLAPEIRAATVRLLTRMGYEAVFAQSEGCCGGLTHHMGKADAARAAARRNITAWSAEIAKGDIAAILTTASGCGVMLEDYGHMFREDPALAELARRVSDLAQDITEFIDGSGLPPVVDHPELSVAYHAACSLQHGQKVTATPKRLLAAAGFEVRDIPDGHLCCGSAGTYNILQSEIAGQLLERKLETIDRTGADLIAAGNIGCLTQIGSGSRRPIVHTVELLDWATGGPRPEGLTSL
jgi:glycolate oxidase iron-sulfur subunit